MMRPRDEHDDAYCLALAKTIERLEIRYACIECDESDSEPLVCVAYKHGEMPEDMWGKWMVAKIATTNAFAWHARLSAFHPKTSELFFMARPDKIDREVARAAASKRILPRISSITFIVSLPVRQYRREFLLLQ